MSYRTVDMVFDIKDLSHIEFRVFAILARYDRFPGNRPSMEELAEMACISPRYAREVMSKLEEKGLIVASRKGGRGNVPEVQFCFPDELVKQHDEKWKPRHIKHPHKLRLVKTEDDPLEGLEEYYDAGTE